MTPCIFCQIVAGQAPARIVYRDDDVIAFHDIAPQAPTHILIVPVRHIAALAELDARDADLIGHLIVTAIDIARTERLEAGYRLVISTGPHGGQTVGHLHVHLLGSRQMMWPPG
jgi:histidine triad (HIT) family protein